MTAEEERFFYRLIVQCDDYGRFDARPQVIRAKCFPLKIDQLNNKQIEKWLFKLQSAGLLFMYLAEGRTFLQLKTWNKHQQIRAKKSKFPAFDGNESNLISNDINCKQPQSNVPVIQSNPIQSESNTAFDFFWKAYPRKEAKQDARKAWDKIDPSLYALIMDKLAKMKLTDRWREKGGQYIPHAATWLNGRRWEDELPRLLSPDHLPNLTGLADRERAELSAKTRNSMPL